MEEIKESGNAIKKLVKKQAKKDEVIELKREMARLKRESNVKIKKFESQVKGLDEDAQKKGEEIGKLKTELEKKRKDLSRLKRESSSKIKELESKVEEITEELGEKVKELQASKGLLGQREVDLNGLRGEVEYKNKRLAAKDMEMENYKKVTEERIFQLEAKVKELEGKVGESSSTS